MILGLARFTLRLNRLTLILVCLGLFVFELLFVAFYAAMRPDETMTGLFERIPAFFRTFLSNAYLDLLSLDGFLAFGFTHPLVLVLLWTGTIALTSRAIHEGAGPGLTDLMHSLPMPRIHRLAARIAAGEVAGFLFIFCLWLGHFTGVTFMNLPGEPDPMNFLRIAINGYAYVLAVQGMGLLVAALSGSRGKALGASVVVLTIMFLLNVFGQAWSLFAWPARLSFLYYYMPGRVILDGEFPWTDVGVLLAFYLTCIVAALYFYRKRDL